MRVVKSHMKFFPFVFSPLQIPIIAYLFMRTEKHTLPSQERIVQQLSLKVAPYIFNILEPLSFNGVIEPFFITK